MRMCGPSGCWDGPRKREAWRPAPAEGGVPAAHPGEMAVVLLGKHSSQRGKPRLRGDASCPSSGEAPGKWICALLGGGKSSHLCFVGPGEDVLGQG